MSAPVPGLDAIGEVCQVGFSVGDLEAALPAFEAMFGPFTVREVTLPDVRYLGRTVTVDIKIAYSSERAVQVQLVQQLTEDGPWAVPAGSPPTVSVLKLTVADYDEAIAALERQEYAPVLGGTVAGVSFAIYRSDRLGVGVEVSTYGGRLRSDA